MTRTGSLVVVVLLLLGAVAQAGPRFLGPPITKFCSELPWWLWWFYHWLGKC